MVTCMVRFWLVSLGVVNIGIDLWCHVITTNHKPVSRFHSRTDQLTANMQILTGKQSVFACQNTPPRRVSSVFTNIVNSNNTSQPDVIYQTLCLSTKTNEDINERFNNEVCIIIIRSCAMSISMFLKRLHQRYQPVILSKGRNRAEAGDLMLAWSQNDTTLLD